MGCPGAGKGTQTQRLRKAFGIGTISSGDVLRSHVSRQTAVGLKAKAAIESGELVSDALVSELMLTELEHMPRDQSFILDGFPRTVTQAETLDSFMAASDRPLDLVINLDVPWSVILQRIEDRWIHAPSGRTYNISYNPPKRAGRDDVTGEPLTKRADDNVEVFRARLHAYQEQTLPLLGYYSDRGILYSFKGSTSDEIFPQIHSMLCDFFSLPQESADATAASASSPVLRFPYTQTPPLVLQTSPVAGDDPATAWFHVADLASTVEIRVNWPATDPTDFEMRLVCQSEKCERVLLRLRARNSGIPVPLGREDESPPPSFVRFSIVLERCLFGAVPVSAIPSALLAIVLVAIAAPQVLANEARIVRLLTSDAAEKGAPNRRKKD